MNLATSYAWRLDFSAAVVTPKKDAQQCQCFHLETCLNDLPSIRQFSFRTCQLDVVNVYSQEQLQLIMEIRRRPHLRGRSEPNLPKMRIIMIFPAIARIGMTIQSQDKADNGFSHMSHFLPSQASGGKQIHVPAPDNFA